MKTAGHDLAPSNAPGQRLSPNFRGQPEIEDRRTGRGQPLSRGCVKKENASSEAVPDFWGQLWDSSQPERRRGCPRTPPSLKEGVRDTRRLSCTQEREHDELSRLREKWECTQDSRWSLSGRAPALRWPMAYEECGTRRDRRDRSCEEDRRHDHSGRVDGFAAALGPSRFLGSTRMQTRMGGVAKPPTDEQIAETVADLERLRVPITATLADARAALQNANSGVSTDRLRSAVNRRKAAAGLTPRNSDASKPKARRKTERTNSTERTRATELALSVLIDPRLFGAACVGHHDLFDASHHGERWADGHARHEAASQICARCPVFAACDEVANENPRSVAGVWAGRVRSNSRSSKGVTP